MNEDAIIKVGFEADFSELEEQVDKLKDRIENADLGTDNVTELLEEERKLTTEINNYADGLDDVSKKSAAFDNLIKKVKELGAAAGELRKNWAESQENAAELQEMMSNAKGMINVASLGLGAVAFVTSAVKGLKLSLEILGKAGKTTGNLLIAGFTKVGSVLTSIASHIANNVKVKLSNIANSIKSLINIDIKSLGTQAINVANDFKNLGTTGAIVARSLSNSFYEAAGSSYESLVKVSNGTQKVTETLKKFINSWTGQVTLMKAQLTAIGTNIGNLLVKVFYPLLVVLNKILAVVNLLLSKLAALFGFNTSSLKNLLGSGIGGQSANQNKGLEDYSKAANKASKATKKLSDQTKKAKENLQGYDKLNNTTTDDLDALTDALDDISDLGDMGAGGLIDTDVLFDNLMKDLNLIPDWLKQWIDELVNLIKAGDWYGVGSKIGELVNKGLYALEDFLSDPSLMAKIKRFNSALLDFVNGTLDEIDWNVLGKDIALALNTITGAIDDLYTQAVQKGTLIKIGKALHDTFMGFIKNFNAKQAGRAVVSGARAIIDILYAAIDTITSVEVNKLAESISEFVSGAFERLFGTNEGELESGAEKIGKGIVKLINIGLKTAGKLFNAETAHNLAQIISDMLNSAIENFNKEDFAKALSGIMSFIGTLLSELAEEINTDDFIDNIVYGINESINNGSVEKLAKGLTEFVVKLFDSLKKIIKDTDKSGLFQAIIDGFTEGGGLSLIGDWATFVLAPFILAALAKGIAVYGASKFLLGRAFKSALSAALKDAGIENVGSAAAETTGKVGGLTKVLKPLGKTLGAIGGAVMIFDGVNKELTEGIDLANTLETVLGGALLGFSIAGPLGALAVGLATALFSLDQFGKQYPEKVAEIGEKVGDIIGKGLVAVHNKFEEGKQTLATIMEWIGSLIGQKIVNIVNDFLQFQQMWESVKQLFNDGVANLQAKAEELRTNIENKVNEIIDGIENGFNNLINEAYSWGYDLISGIIEGIGQKARDLYGSVTGVVNDIKSAFTGGLKISSPSKVMRDIAIYIPEGIALGIEDGENYVDSAMDSMLDSIKFSDFYNESLNETDAFVTSISDKLAEIQTPTLDSLKYQGRLLSNPVSTARTLSQSYADNAGQRTDGVLASIYNRMISAGQATGRNVIVDVYLDKNNRLGEYIIDTMKGNVVMTGGV